MGKIKRN